VHTHTYICIYRSIYLSTYLSVYLCIYTYISIYKYIYINLQVAQQDVLWLEVAMHDPLVAQKHQRLQQLLGEEAHQRERESAAAVLLRTMGGVWVQGWASYCRDGGNTFTPKRYRLEPNSAHTFTRSQGLPQPTQRLKFYSSCRRALERAGVCGDCSNCLAQLLSEESHQQEREPTAAVLLRTMGRGTGSGLGLFSRLVRAGGHRRGSGLR